MTPTPAPASAAFAAVAPRAGSSWTWHWVFPQAELLAGYDIRTVQELLGHADVSTTTVYTHVLRMGGGAVRSPPDSLVITLAAAAAAAPAPPARRLQLHHPKPEGPLPLRAGLPPARRSALPGTAASATAAVIVRAREPCP